MLQKFQPRIHSLFLRRSRRRQTDVVARHAKVNRRTAWQGEKRARQLDYRDTKKDVANGDGIIFFNHKGSLSGFRANSVSGKAITPFEKETVAPGTMLYRNFDKVFNDTLVDGKSLCAQSMLQSVAGRWTEE